MENRLPSHCVLIVWVQLEREVHLVTQASSSCVAVWSLQTAVRCLPLASLPEGTVERLKMERL